MDDLDPGSYNVSGGSQFGIGVLENGKRQAFSRRAYMVSMFAITTALLFADQNLLAPNLSDAAADFGFDSKQRDKYLGGVVSAVFFLVGAPAAVLVGYLMTIYDRRLILWCCVLLGELPCMATVFVTKFWHLLLTRALTGVSIGGAAPIIYALLSDLYPSSARSALATIIVISTGAGTALGQAIAGTAGLDWRTPFVLVAVPAVVVATVMLLTTEDPKKGASEEALRGRYEADADFEYNEKLTWNKLKLLLRIPTNVLVILQGLPGCLPWGMMIAYMNDYLDEDKGLSKQHATLVVLMYGAGNAVGCVGGGLLGQGLYNWKKGALGVYSGVCVWLGMPMLYWLINGDVKRSSNALVVFVSLVGGSFAGVAGVTVRPLIMNVNEPETRGMALALQATLDDIGKGFGPAIVAVLIAWSDRRTAFNVAVSGWVLCGLMILGTGFTLARDEAAMQTRLGQQVLQVPYQSVQLADIDDESDDALPDAAGVQMPIAMESR